MQTEQIRELQTDLKSACTRSEDLLHELKSRPETPEGPNKHQMPHQQQKPPAPTFESKIKESLKEIAETIAERKLQAEAVPYQPAYQEPIYQHPTPVYQQHQWLNQRPYQRGNFNRRGRYNGYY